MKEIFEPWAMTDKQVAIAITRLTGAMNRTAKLEQLRRRDPERDMLAEAIAILTVHRAKARSSKRLENLVVPILNLLSIEDPDLIEQVAGILHTWGALNGEQVIIKKN